MGFTVGDVLSDRDGEADATSTDVEGWKGWRGVEHQGSTFEEKGRERDIVGSSRSLV
jgi:hypothetical protein